MYFLGTGNLEIIDEIHRANYYRKIVTKRAEDVAGEAQ